ncbi:hypothetical protein [Porphyromonas gingivalis]|uniref:hypothetical protein n=1 Tax=Porphyromonas gingivalis TaxID=837 RepID=UPI001B8BD107|nr:hypothetical protein [Porphyromonas gingivalis]QUI89028.1 hypothetical protein KDH82_07175 [Porphyromonas gingivalis]QUI90972.1 hypothetical protein KC155_07165 [Porphyromonas gingivalis]
MNTFDFYQDSKVTCWMRTKFQVKAENYEQAVAIIKSWQGEDVMNHDDEEQVIFVEGETLLDTSENLSPEENGGRPTIEVFDDKGKEITNNLNP